MLDINTLRLLYTISMDGALIRYDENNRLHRLGKPAYYHNGYYMWYKHGKLHNNRSPAVYMPNAMEYFIDEVRHRRDGPALLMDSLQECWYRRGLLCQKLGAASTDARYNALHAMRGRVYFRMI